MLPIVATGWIFYFLYQTFYRLILQPAGLVVRWLLLRIAGRDANLMVPGWWENYASPVLAVLAALGLVYLLGYFVRSRLLRALDWVFLRVPGVMIVYKAARNVFQSMESYRASPISKRIVLIEYPHPGSRAPAFVSKVLRDGDSGEAILCVWIMTNAWTLTGLTLFVPEKDVTETDWTTNEVFQLILSGGVTAPPIIRYRSGGPTRLIVPGRPDEGEFHPPFDAGV